MEMLTLPINNLTELRFCFINEQLILIKIPCIAENKEAKLIKAKSLLSLMIILVLTVAGLHAQSEQVQSIKTITAEKAAQKLLVKIEFEKGIAYESFTLFNPNRLIIDFMNVSSIESEPVIDVDGFGVSKIRIGYPSSNTSRVVFDFAGDFPFYKIDEVDAGLEVSFWQEAKEVKAEEERPAVTAPKKVKTEESRPMPVKKKPVVTRKKPETKAFQLAEEAAQTDRAFTVGVLSGLYFMSDDVFQEVYGNSLFFYGLEYSFNLPIKSVNSLNIWMGFKNMSKSGSTTFLEEEVNLRMLHFSLALRYLFPAGRFVPFIGPGIEYINYKESYPDDFPIDAVEGSKLGFHIQGGSYFNINDFLAAKLYLKYVIANTTENEVEVSLGGLELGISFVYRFDL